MDLVTQFQYEVVDFRSVIMGDDLDAKGRHINAYCGSAAPYTKEVADKVLNEDPCLRHLLDGLEEHQDTMYELDGSRCSQPQEVHQSREGPDKQVRGLCETN